MKAYRGINYEFKNDHFVHFYNPRATYHHDSNIYGRDCLIRSIPDKCSVSDIAFAKTVIDQLYDRLETYQRQETRIFYASKTTKYEKNVYK